MARNDQKLSGNSHQSETKYLVKLSGPLPGVTRGQAGQSDGKN